MSKCRAAHRLGKAASGFLGDQSAGPTRRQRPASAEDKKLARTLQFLREHLHVRNEVLQILSEADGNLGEFAISWFRIAAAPQRSKNFEGKQRRNIGLRRYGELVSAVRRDGEAGLLG